MTGLETTRKTTRQFGIPNSDKLALQGLCITLTISFYFCLSFWQAFQCFECFKLERLFIRGRQHYNQQCCTNVLFLSYLSFVNSMKTFCACVGDINKHEAWLNVSQMFVIFVIICRSLRSEKIENF